MLKLPQLLEHAIASSPLQHRRAIRYNLLCGLYSLRHHIKGFSLLSLMQKKRLKTTLVSKPKKHSIRKGIKNNTWGGYVEKKLEFCQSNN